jgi:hypothetical protein
MFSHTFAKEEKIKYLAILMKKFYIERKQMPILSKIELSNFIVD